jgi:hypothetical protein
MVKAWPTQGVSARRGGRWGGIPCRCARGVGVPGLYRRLAMKSEGGRMSAEVGRLKATGRRGASLPPGRAGGCVSVWRLIRLPREGGDPGSEKRPGGSPPARGRRNNACGAFPRGRGSGFFGISGPCHTLKTQ